MVISKQTQGHHNKSYMINHINTFWVKSEDSRGLVTKHEQNNNNNNKKKCRKKKYSKVGAQLRFLFFKKKNILFYGWHSLRYIHPWKYINIPQAGV